MKEVSKEMYEKFKSYFDKDLRGGILNALRIGMRKTFGNRGANEVYRSSKFDGIDEVLYLTVDCNAEGKQNEEKVITYDIRSLLSIAGISNEVAWKTAFQNTCEETEINHLDQELFGKESEEESLRREMVSPVYVVRNTSYKLGAGGILDIEKLKKMAKRTNRKWFVAMPSSVHEWILAGFESKTEAELQIEHLGETVEEVNNTCVDQEDILGTHAYLLNLGEECTEVMPEQMQFSELPAVEDQELESPLPDVPVLEQDLMLRVLLVEVGKDPHVVEIPHKLEELQKLVEGPIETVCYFEDDPDVVLVCNEEGKITGLPLNRKIISKKGELQDLIAGSFFLCYAPPFAEDFESLPGDLIQKYSEKFKL